ncbi:hypothetical protein BAE44_0006614 [Dichanthelium oligosanthes]|uniref:Uncharacterized protein n=1 Tax=Dichanthelium oligosanthes TaxID=888268 RepID=A0A1E5W4T8_9POAL|nr:hypothetical protein BAE44_0006614 [Dichanthelium oligosanthes]
MDFPKREPALPQGSPRRSPKAMGPGAAATEADENASPKRPAPAWAASPQRKKVLGERNDGGGAGTEAAATPPPQPQSQPKPIPSSPTLTSRGAGAYDPKTNYTTPRPEFLRYDPERRREILLRVARAAEVEDDDCSSDASGSAASEDDGGSVASDAAATSPVSPARRSDSEAELDDSNDDEEVVAPPRRGRWARRLFLLLVAVACSFCYMSCMNPAAFPGHSEDGFDFIGPIGGMYDAGDSLRLSGSVYMMGPEDVLEETTDQIVLGNGVDVVHQCDQRASPQNLVAVNMNVPLGESTCQIGGGGNSDNVADLKEDSELDEHETEVAIESLKKDEQSSEGGCLGGNISLDSIGSTSTHTADMEESRSGLVHQEEGEEDHSNQFVLQLVSREKAIESASEKLDNRYSLESEELNLDTELWQYENTAEAAKAIYSTVKFLWSAMEPYLLQILACLSLAGFAAAMFYFQRSREMAAPALQHMPSKSLVEGPVLIPHHILQLPVPPSPQTVQLPVDSSEQPTQLTVPKQGLSGSLDVPMELPFPKADLFVKLKDPVQEPLPKRDPFVSLKVPVDHGNRDQKLQQGDANSMNDSNGNFLNHRNVDSSRPPVVELLGEFTFANSSRGRSIKSLNQYAGDAAVEELSEPLGKDVDKMQMNSSFVQSPSVRRGRKEENSVKGEMTETPAPLTPTPLRRSSRLRNKLARLDMIVMNKLVVRYSSLSKGMVSRELNSNSAVILVT